MIESTNGKFCYRWALVEIKAPAMFKDASVCGDWCANFSKEHNTCIDMLDKYLRIKSRMDMM